MLGVNKHVSMLIGELGKRTDTINNAQFGDERSLPTLSLGVFKLSISHG
jgi:hypothetical protein